MVRRGRSRGFSLIGVLLILIMLVTALLAALSSAGDSMRSSKLLRDRTLVRAANQAAMNLVLDELAEMDPDGLLGMGAEHDLFGNPEATPLIPAFTYPEDDGPYKGAMTIRVGLVEGQRSRPPAGEDVRSGYGYVYEVQIEVRMTGEAGAGVEERSVVGIRVPQTHAHAN